MCRQKGNSRIKYLQSTLLSPFHFRFLHFLWALHRGATLRPPSFISGSEFRPKRCEGEETRGVLTVDCDFHRFGVRGSDVVQGAAFIVASLVSRDASDVQMFAAVVLPAWKQKAEHVQGCDSGYVAAG